MMRMDIRNEPYVALGQYDSRWIVKNTKNRQDDPRAIALWMFTVAVFLPTLVVLLPRQSTQLWATAIAASGFCVIGALCIARAVVVIRLSKKSLEIARLGSMKTIKWTDVVNVRVVITEDGKSVAIVLDKNGEALAEIPRLPFGDQQFSEIIEHLPVPVETRAA